MKPRFVLFGLIGLSLAAVTTAAAIGSYFLLGYSFYEGDTGTGTEPPDLTLLGAFVLMLCGTVLAGFGSAEAWECARRVGSNRKLVVLGTGCLSLIGAALFLAYG